MGLMRIAAGAPCLALAVASCGPPLGDYRVDEVRAESWEMLNRVDPQLQPARTSGNVLRIQFSSETDVEVASDGGDLYLLADFCPGEPDFRFRLFGPYYGDRSRYAGFRTRVTELPDGRTVGVSEGRPLHPPRDPRTGRYVYSAYLVPHAAAQHGQFPQDAYDLRRDRRDVCLRLHHPGYYLTKSQSRVFTLRGTDIARALRGRD